MKNSEVCKMFVNGANEGNGSNMRINNNRLYSYNTCICERFVNERGETVYLLSCNMRPNNMWQSPCPVNKNKDVYDSTFENVINDYRYYNCDNERGKYPIFFIKA